ncbi:hypothetical protein [Streptococcus suis]|uniref:hypothetical protein n=1 Tax=Streptococcus suis TaxID=1307 RepID=UPI000404F6E0|nr:hypothetical protein [Streptococcus suis]HEL2496381.1 hypothetical protein [Streptococcus suis]
MEKIIIACIIGIFIYCIRNFFIGQRRDELLNQGAIESRDKLFLSQEHCFFSSKISSVQEILSVLDTSSLKDNHIQLIKTTDDGDAVFKITNNIIVKESYVLALLASEIRNEEKVYVLVITNTYNCDKSIIENPYNVLLTQVERAIKKLDSNATVERRVIQYHTTK